MEPAWDAIVIGSGIGGMSAAGFLAKVGKMKVLVLEKHWERGGQTHVFRRDGACWEVGLHYVGGIEKGSIVRTLIDFLSGGALEWNPMTDEFERFIYPGLELAVPSDAGRYRARLIERFPDEERAIRAYFRDLHAAAQWHVLGMQQQFLPPPLGFLIKQWRRLGAAKATQTTAEYLNRHFRSPQLKALLATQWGDYGLPPKESAFAVHALVVDSYMNGAWFPKGGAGRIARAFEQGIEASGGAIKVSHEVTSILIEGGRAVGVKALDRRGAEPVEVVFRAPIVISDVGARATYRRLLPTDGEIGRRTAKARACIDALEGGYSAVSLYIRLAQPASTLGVKGENYWINTTFEHDELEAETAATLAGAPRHAYLSFPSAKSGDDRFPNAEVITFVRPDAFAAWRGGSTGQRGPQYAELKTRIAEGLLKLADSAVPGLKALTRYSELSTPLTMEDFTSHPAGRFYGLPGTPARYRMGAAFGAFADRWPLSQRLRRRLARHSGRYDGRLCRGEQGSRDLWLCSHHGGGSANREARAGACALGGKAARHVGRQVSDDAVDLASRVRTRRAHPLRSRPVSQALRRAVRMARLFDRRGRRQSRDAVDQHAHARRRLALRWRG